MAGTPAWKAAMPDLRPVAAGPSPLPPAVPRHLWAVAAAHAAMRRDALRLHRRLPTIRTSADAGALERWWRCFRGAVAAHHERAAAVVWPALEADDPAFAADAAELRGQRSALDRALAATDAALTDLVRTGVDGAGRRHAAEAAGQLREVLAVHLERQEDLVLTRLAAWDATAYAAVERRVEDAGPRRDLAFEVPWTLDDTTAERGAHLLRRLPVPTRHLATRRWRRRYHRLTAVLRMVAS